MERIPDISEDMPSRVSCFECVLPVQTEDDIDGKEAQYFCRCIFTVRMGSKHRM